MVGTSPEKETAGTRPVDEKDARGRIAGWLNHRGNRGASSEAILRSAVTGRAVGTHQYPHDPDDLQRCITLLQQVPTSRAPLERRGRDGRYRFYKSA